MKYSISILLLILTTGFLTKAQSVDHDIQNSFQQAHEEDKIVLLVFSGSDWCKPCIQLKQKILSDVTFTDYSASRLLIHEVDFPYKKKNKLPKAKQQQNDALAAQYNKEGIFPKVMMLNSEKKILGEINYEQYMTVDQFINQISKLEKQ